jgi:predicted transcriptional regulator YdeE
MEHKTVSLEERHFVGIWTRIEDPSSASFFIGALWDKFHREHIYTKVQGSISDEFYGVYYDYAGDHTKPYSILAGCEVKAGTKAPEGMACVSSPKGSYELYEVIGLFPEFLIKTWQDVWADKELKRSFKVDFEHYGPKFQTEPPQVDLYIGI